MNLQVSLQRATNGLLSQSNLRLRIGAHMIDVGALRMPSRPEHPRLTSKAMAVLIELVRDAGQTVTREELLDRVWAGRCPTPDVLTQAIKELRRAFADDSKPPRYIETIPKVGYRLIAPVLVLDGPDRGLFVEDASAPALNDSDSDDAHAPREPESALQPLPARTWKTVLILAAGLLAAAIVIAVLAYKLPASDRSGAPRWRVSDARALTSDPGSEYRPHLSPDGTRVAYSIFDPSSRQERLVVREVEPSQLVRLTAGGNAIEALPAWSPDGTQIAFERLGPHYCQMFVVPSLGGSEWEIGTCQDFLFNHFDWTPDGRSLISSQRSDGGKGPFTLFTWDLPSGEKHRFAYARASENQDIDAHYSPDGRRIAFRRGLGAYSDLYVMPADGAAARRVTHISSNIIGYTWTADNRTLVYSSNVKGAPALYAVDVDDGHTDALGISPAEYPHAGQSGDALVYEITRTQDKLTLMPLGATAAPSRVLAPSTGSDFTPVLSPNGDRVVFTSDRSGQLQLWLYDLASATTTQLTEIADQPVFSPRWSFDGKRILAVRRSEGVKRLIEIDLASRRQRVLSQPGENVVFGDYGAAADTYLFALRTSGRNAQLIRVAHPRSANESRTTLLADVVHAQVEPATRSLYYTTRGADGLFRRDLDSGADRLVTDKVTAQSFDGWRVVDGRIWYLADLGVRTAMLHEFDPTNGEDRVVSHLDALLQDISFSVTPARDALIFAPVDVEDTDIGMFRLTRTNAS
jgi:Tol biopolymer transport system component/DNA-binding winged helix-turn-helix (wHTH) protein